MPWRSVGWMVQAGLGDRAGLEATCRWPPPYTEFCFGGDCFGFENISERVFSAEAIGKVVVMRYQRRATERLIDENPLLARCLCDMTLRDLAHAQTRTLLLGVDCARAGREFSSRDVGAARYEPSGRPADVAQ